MSFANVDIGNSPGDGSGDSLRSAFNKINQNFANIAESRIDVTVESPVQSVAGRTGNVVLTVNDIPGATSTGYVDSQTQYAISVSNAYADLRISTRIGELLDSAPEALNTLNELAAALGDDAEFASVITDRISEIESQVSTLRLGSTEGLTAETAARVSGDSNLQTQLTTTNSNLTSEIERATDEEQRIEAKVDAEINRATDAEESLASDVAVLRTDLDSEVEDRTIADSTLQSNLDSAVADLQASDANIESLLNTEISNRDTAVNTVQSNLDAETQARTDADTDLQTQIDNILNNTDPAALDSLTEIVDAFQAADGSLTATVGALQTSLSASIATVQSNLDTEQAARIAADDQFGSDLMSEAAARYTGDTTLQNNIDAEATARQTRDSQLETGIDNVAGSVTALATRVTAVETDKATITYVDDAIAAIPATDFTGYATETYVDDAVSNLVNSAPGTLDTLNELAAALGDDANFSTTITNLIADVQSNVDVISTALASKADSVDLVNAANWDSAYSWGDHSLAGYVKSVGGELPDANGDVTVSKNSVVTALQYAPVSSVNGVVPSPSTGALVLDLADFTDTTNLIPTVPTAVSQLDNDAGYLTADDIAVDTGNFTFSSNTLGVSDANGGITINANGDGEIVMSDNVGIQNDNPGYMLHVGKQTDIDQTGSIGIAYGDVNTIAGVVTDSVFTAHQMGGEVSLTWDWYASVDGTPKGSYNGDTTNHARFGIFKNGSLSTPWLTFDRDAPGDVLAVDAQGRLKVTNGTGIDTVTAGTSYSDSNFKVFDPWGALFVTNHEMSSNGSGTTSITDVGHSFLVEASVTENLSKYDRIRGFSSSLDVVLNGYQWDAWYKFPTVAGATQSIKVIGSGTISQSVGNASYSIINATTGSLNIVDTTGETPEDTDYGTSIGSLGGSQLIVTDPDGAGSTVDIAAGLSAAIYVEGNNGAATVTNAVGLYLPYRSNAGNSWARTNGSAASITNRFSIHSEDPDAVLRNYGNIETNGSLKFSNGSLTFKITDVPASSIGQAGDIVGMTANDANYHYYCAADYDGVTDIWKRVAWTSDTW